MNKSLLKIMIKKLLNFCLSKKDKELLINDFKISLIGLNKDTKIRMIIQKLINHSFDLVILFENNIINGYFHKNLLYITGHYDINKIQLFNDLIVPIYINGETKYSVHFCNIIKKKKIKINYKLLRFLQEVLEN